MFGISGCLGEMAELSRSPRRRAIPPAQGCRAAKSGLEPVIAAQRSTGMPYWLHLISIASLAIAFACAVGLAVDVALHPQKMWIMNLVWPLSALFSSFLTLAFYLAYGRATGNRARKEKPFPASVASGALHCGSGCTLGDICAEWLAFFLPAVAVAFGAGWLFTNKIFAIWIVDYIFAFAFGILFQYFTIAPMRDLSVGEGLVAAIKADALSLTSWQVGMYGFMAFAKFYLFANVLGAELRVDSPEFWFMMQIAMLCGFATAYPVNWYLIRAGLKEKM